ncbi:MAG: hypothetical protein ABIQ35_05690, partial [Verrucomicrobiota bacterium]
DLTLYVGGDFISIAGQARDRIAALTASSGAAAAWNPGASNGVSALAISGTTLYVGGTLTNIGGIGRGRIASVDANTGVTTGWNPDAGSTGTFRVNVLATAPNTVYVAGTFNILGGSFRTNVAGVALSVAQANAWAPAPNAQVRTLVRTPEAIYIGGDFTTINGALQPYFAAFSAAPIFDVTKTVYLPNGEFQTRITSGDGQRLLIQASTDLAAWSNAATNTDLRGFPINFTNAPNAAYRFYRAVLE